MFVGLTHKFDSAEDAHTGDWIMSMPNYSLAQYNGDNLLFVQEALASSKLAVKQGKAGFVWRFKFESDFRTNLEKVARPCGLAD